jgi:hypothetical protein
MAQGKSQDQGHPPRAPQSNPRNSPIPLISMTPRPRGLL